MHHPWRILRGHAHLRFVVDDLGDDGPLGCTDGNTITLTTGLAQVERRCVLMHELVHLERGIPHGHCPREESAVEVEVARRLIGFDRMVDALRWSQSIDEAADELWVMPHLLQLRLDRLHPSERHALRAALGHDEPDHTNTTQGEHP